MAGMETTVKRARVDGLEIEWEEAGSGERAFVLVHGFTGSRDDWAEVLPELARGGRTVAPDLRGHGGTANPGDAAGYTFERLVADVVGWLDALGLARVDLLGHSMGGMVAQRLALAHPERVASLVLMDTAPGPVEVLPAAVLEAASQVARNDGTGALLPAMRGAAASDPRRPASSRRCEERMGAERYWERIERKMHAMDPEAFATLGALLTTHAPILERLGTLACPTLVMVGAEDTPFLEPSRAMAAAIPGAELVIVPDAAHSPQLENTAAWLEAVRSHLAGARG